jgi:hypothetical protein
VQADLFAIVDTYAQITESYAQKLIHDIRILLDEEVIDRVRFLWTLPGTNTVVGAYSYKVISAGVGLADDRSGGIRYDRVLHASEFKVRIHYSDRWKRLGQTEKDSIRKRLELSWSPGGELDFGQGQWKGDRTYSKDGYGLGREYFAR